MVFSYRFRATCRADGLTYICQECTNSEFMTSVMCVVQQVVGSEEYTIVSA